VLTVIAGLLRHLQAAASAAAGGRAEGPGDGCRWLLPGAGPAV